MYYKLTKNEKEEIKNIVKQAHALLTINEAKLLYYLAKTINKKGVIVEIGSYKGGSTIVLAKGSKSVNKEKVYAIDPHNTLPPGRIGKEIFPKTTLQIFKKNIKKTKVDDYIIPIFKTSQEAEKDWNKPIKLLWIDGNHDYEFVKMDYLLWEKYLIKGGIIAFHDTKSSKNIIETIGLPAEKYDGPAKVVEEYILNSKKFKNIKSIDTITLAQKVKNITNKESIDIKDNIHKILGQIGIFINKLSPKTYQLIKKIKR